MLPTANLARMDTIADYFKYEKEIYRAIISAAVSSGLQYMNTPATMAETGKGNRPQTV